LERNVQPTSGAIKAANRASVVDALRRGGSATRAQLMEATGLSRATVSSLIGEMRSQGLVSEQRPAVIDGFGRPPATIALERSAGLAIGVDVGVRHVAVAVGDLSHRVLAERWVALPHGHDASKGVRLVLRSIEETLVEAEADPRQIVGAAISIARPISPDTGRMMVPGVLGGWNGHELATEVARRWDIPVTVENDANLGALGEWLWGQSQGAETLLYIKVASGVGLGIVIDGEIYHGADGCAGELGHITVDPEGDLCWCGQRGCLEMYIGGEGLIRRLGLESRNEIDLRQLVANTPEISPRLPALIESGAEVLARAISTLALLFNPSVIVIGGEIAMLGELVLGPARRAVQSVPFGSPVRVELSSLEDRAPVAGALALVLSDASSFVDQTAVPSAGLGRDLPLASVT
jgi:predicted NBD/HSP70 family sugar kinase